VETRYQQPERSVDCGAEIEQLEKQKARLLAAIKMGGELDVLVAELKATEAKLGKLLALVLMPGLCLTSSHASRWSVVWLGCAPS
jgi:hypothetical protein